MQGVHNTLKGEFPAVHPRDRARIQSRVLRPLTPQSCQEALKEAWQQKGQLTMNAVGEGDLGPDSSQVLQKSLTTCRQKATSPWNLREEGDFAYHTPKIKPSVTADSSQAGDVNTCGRDQV